MTYFRRQTLAPVGSVLRAAGFGVVFVFAWGASARADQIRFGSENHVRARVLGIQEGRLRFQTDDRSVRDVWLDEVSFMQVDREGAFVDFNEGERLLVDRRFDEAVTQFRRTMRATGDFWSELANVRMAMAADGAQQVDVVVEALVRVMNREMLGPEAAARLLPTDIPRDKGLRSSKALGAIDTALTSVSSESERTLLLVMRHDVLRTTGDADASAAAARLIRQTVPASVATDRVFASVQAALVGAFPEAWDDAAMAALDRAIALCPERQASGFLLLRGRALAKSAVTAEDKLRATWPFLRIAAHFPKDPVVPEALLEAGALLQSAGQRENAAALYAECAAHELATPELKRKAESLLAEPRR